MHIIQHTFSLLVIVQCVTVININHQRSKLGERNRVDICLTKNMASVGQIYSKVLAKNV